MVRPEVGEERIVDPIKSGGLQRHFGLLQAVALNVTMVVGAGIFITIPPMLEKLAGPYAVLGWIGAGALILVDGLIWSELGAALPGSGGTYLYLLESFGSQRWGRLMAFLFIWQFLISGPLEIGSGLIAIAQFAPSLHPKFAALCADTAWNWKWEFGAWQDKPLVIAFGPARALALVIGGLILFLLYRRITILGKLTVTFWLGVLAVIAWILVEGWSRFDPVVAFDWPTSATVGGEPFGWMLGMTMILAMYSYLGYYNICYVGDEVRDPGRTIPRAILISSLLVCLLFVGLHLAMLGTISWRDVPEATKNQSLPAAFMTKLHPDWAVQLVTALLIWSVVGSAFAGLLGYSRIPYGAARYGHFFKLLDKIHPRHRIPHVSLLLVGGMTLFWGLFDLESVIFALLTTRIIEQFLAQIVAVVLLRRARPDIVRPYKMWLYPLPCVLAFAGWVYLYVSAGVPYMLFGAVTLAAGIVAFLLWARQARGWPFGPASA
jgi:amino acid transporter